jgi:ABC-type proline/glycine betaine transport system permease subunit
MSALLLFLALDFALVALAVVLLLAVIIRRGRAPQYLALAALLIILALGVWYTAIRTPPVLP